MTEDPEAIMRGLYRRLGLPEPKWYRETTDGVKEGPPGLPPIEDRVVAKDTVGFEVEVSTVFLALDHAIGYGDPILYETMIFGGPLDGMCRRYSTRDQASVGHQEVLWEAMQASAKPA